MINNSATIAYDKEKFNLITKPHGHGDVHNLMYHSGVIQKWNKMGKEWMIYFQDTNCLALRTIPSVLGVSRKNNWVMNTISVPRKPGEAMGSICRLVHETDST